VDVAPDGDVKLIVNVPAEELAVTFVGVPGALEEVTVIVLVAVPKVPPLPARNIIVAGDAAAVPLPGIPGVVGVWVSDIGLQLDPASELY
jgi:hypothetical protein